MFLNGCPKGLHGDDQNSCTGEAQRKVLRSGPVKIFHCCQVEGPIGFEESPKGKPEVFRYAAVQEDMLNGLGKRTEFTDNRFYRKVLLPLENPCHDCARVNLLEEASLLHVKLASAKTNEYRLV